MGHPVVILGGLALIVAIIASMGKKAEAAPQPKEKLLPSPLPGVSDSQWTAFVRGLASAPFSYESPKGFYGAFVFGVRRLCDLKIMKDPKKSSTGVWSGTWVVPKATFLGSPTLQYEALGRSMAAHAKVISVKYSSAIGKTLDGKKVTLSGLLGAAHIAGATGLGSWLKDPAYRAKFKHVTAAFNKLTGIF